MSNFYFDCGNSDLLNKDTELIAHYTTREKGIEGVLATQSLRFNTRKNVNDPRESSLRGSTIGWLGDQGEEYVPEVLNGLSDAVNKHLQICCFSESNDEAFPDLIGQCFCLPNMWANYAGNHEGMCFLFDKKKLLNLIPSKLFLFESPISYKHYPIDDYKFTNFGGFSIIDEKFDGDIPAFLKDHCKKNGAPLFFQKDKCWEHEQEYRILIHSENDMNFTDIDFRDTLQGIVLGVNFNYAYLPSIERMLRNDSVLARLEWSNIPCGYQLNSIS